MKGAKEFNGDVSTMFFGMLVICSSLGLIIGFVGRFKGDVLEGGYRAYYPILMTTTPLFGAILSMYINKSNSTLLGAELLVLGWFIAMIVFQLIRIMVSKKA